MGQGIDGVRKLTDKEGDEEEDRRREGGDRADFAKEGAISRNELFYVFYAFYDDRLSLRR